MPSLSPEVQFENVKAAVSKSLTSMFPIQSKSGSTLELTEVDFKDDVSSNDVRDQQQSLRDGKSWTIPVYGTFTLKKKSGEPETRRMLLMHLPKTTDRLGYIIEGNEYQVLNQFRLKSGVYHRMAPNGDVLAEFNLQNPDQFANGKSFKVRFEPESAVFYVDHRNSSVPLYPLLKSAGMDDDTLRSAWGKEIFEKNHSKSTPGKAYSALRRAVGDELNNVKPEELFPTLLAKTKLLPETTEKTLGKPYKEVTPELLVTSTKNLLGISKGQRPEDDKTSLEYQAMFSVEDLLAGHLQRKANLLRSKISSTLDKKKTIRAAIPTSGFDAALKSFFNTQLVSQPEQTNPLEMISGALKTTIMGEQGGIKSTYAVSDQAKLINPSHMGFLDPVHTPEGDKTGVSLTIPLGADKRGNEMTASFWSPKKGSKEQVKSGDALRSVVAFPDQYKQVGQKMVPLGNRIKATKNGEIMYVSPKDVDYVVPSPRAMFGISSNMVPFLQNNQGNRAMTAARQQEQAVPLLHREAPLVQVKTDSGTTYEGIVGKYASRQAPVDGEVVRIGKDAVYIKDKGGETHEVQMYKDFALKGNSLYDSEAVVKAGDKVKKGQLIADSTFTRNGSLALGTNLRAAYMPFHGYNFEDGIVISEDAAKKLTSLHVHPKEIPFDKETILDKRKFLSQYQNAYTKSQLELIGDDGIVRIGARVKEGDPLLLALRKPTESQLRKQIMAFRRGRPDKFRDGSLAWDKEASGIVTDVVKRGDQVLVYVKTEEPAQVGDKLVGRHGNKGVITRIVPQAEMPYSADPKTGEKAHVDILLNPLGVPGRINLGQVLETAAGKIAKKTGKPYEVKNFEPGVDYLEKIQGEMKAAGLVDKETLVNPVTGKSYEQQVMTGNQYILKLKHMATKKISARSGSGGEGSHYDINQAPVGGAPHGGQSMGELGMYALLAHGARENIYDMQAYKTNKNDALWDSIREGSPIPAPKTPFAFDKFLKYMNGMRVNVKKEGNNLQLIPFTESQIQELSAGELKEPSLVVRGKDLNPLPGGLFDEKLTGGIQGTRWTHFKLAEPMPNPLFEEAIKKLTGMNENQFRAMVRGDTVVNGKVGGEAVEETLKSIDVKKLRASLESKIQKAKGATRDKYHQQLRIARALDSQNLSPTVYMMRNVPIIPPVFRPVSAKEDGSLSSDDLNGLYKDIGAVNESLRMNHEAKMPGTIVAPVRESLYDGLRAMTGLGGSLTRSGEYKGILDIISGKTRKSSGAAGEGSSKNGFFQRNVMKRRQDFSARSIIIPEPRMGLDELGLPEQIAWSMYQPFIERDLIRQGFNSLDAIEEVKKRTITAERAMQRVILERPVLFKRDPSLHKFNVMAFKPRLVKGKAIEIHPLVTGGYGADFDGDAMSVYLPITSGAVKEAQNLYPSNNLFSPTTGAVMYTPGHEALLGTYLLSLPGKKTNEKFKTVEEAQSAMRLGKISKTDVIRIGGHETTMGRLEIEAKLPAWARETGKKSASDMLVYDKKGIRKTLMAVAKKEPARYGEVVNHLKDIGNENSTNLGFSIGLSDFQVVGKAERDAIVKKTEEQVIKAKKNQSSSQTSDKQVLQILSSAQQDLKQLYERETKKNPTNIYRMMISGSRVDPDQLKQIVSTPALVKDAKDRVVPYLIPKSYSEGLDMASYWSALSGARKGAIQKTQDVRDPGYLSKLIVNSAMNQLITEDDCGTRDGIAMAVDNHDVADRYLSSTVRLGSKRTRAGELVTPELISQAKKFGINNLNVRSPMRCAAPHGICKRCMGLTEAGKSYDIGTNAGVIASQSVGEPATNLSLKSFHTGGTVGSAGSHAVSMFERLRQLLTVPNNLPNEAPLALKSGRVSKIEKAPQGGQYVTIDKVQHYVPATQQMLIKPNQTVKAGDALSDGLVDPKKLMALKGSRATQDYLASSMNAVLSNAAPVKQRNIEVVVRAMTDVSQIEDSSNPDWVPGDIVPTSQVAHYNAQNKNKVRSIPLIKGVDVLPTEVQEDWIARLNFQNLSRTIVQAAREGWRSNIHGFSPIPGSAAATEFNRAQSKLKPGEKWKGQY